jgi:hypothetical protein
VLAGTDGTGGPALAGYVAATGCAVATDAELAPFRRARELEATIWLAAMAHLRPARYRAIADERLAALLGRGSR